MRVLAIFIIFVLSGCSAQWHLKQAIKKDPTILIEDTIIYRDTIVIRDSIISLDTFVMAKIDTITIVNEGIKTEIIRYHDRFIVKQKIKSDTMFLEKRISVPKIIHKTSCPKYWIWLVCGLMALIVFLIFLLGKTSGNE